MAQGDDIHARLLKHAVALGRLCKKLPVNPETTHIRKQLFRCATAAAPNYAEARAAESRQDFIHKLGIVHKELNESLSWLGCLRDLEKIPHSWLEPLVREADELARIIYASIRLARGKQPNDDR
jgi:four helix bundle protein